MGDAEHAGWDREPLWLPMMSQVMCEATAPPQCAVRGLPVPTVGPQNIPNQASVITSSTCPGRQVGKQLELAPFKIGVLGPKGNTQSLGA